MKINFDFKDRDNKWIKTYCYKATQYETLSYSRFRGMHKRCLIGGAEQRNYPRYIGCYSSDPFKDFQYFTDWSIEQKGYENTNWHLDKDILIKGNKLYSENTCVFVPPELNLMLIKTNSRRGKYPIGVYWNKRDEVFTAYVCEESKLRHIGNFNNYVSAFNAYKIAKELYIKRQADKWKPSIDKRVYEALMNYKVEIDD